MVNDLVGYELLHRRSLQNWREGISKTTRDWSPLVAIATVLKLTEEQTNKLLTVAGHRPIAELWDSTNATKRKILELWKEAKLERQEAVIKELSSKFPPLEKPEPVQHFIGREDTIRKILTDLKPSIVVTLCGPGGVGKTALAVEIIWRLSPEDDPPEIFPDGIFFHNFYEERQASQALENIVSRFSLTKREDTLSLTNAARRALEGKRALLVLDGTENAEDWQQVLKIRGLCGVLITSRLRKDVSGRRYDIEALSELNAVGLLKAWAGKRAADEQAVEKLCNLVGRLPLAITLMGGYLSQAEINATEFLPVLQNEGLEALDFGRRQRESVKILLKKSTDHLSTPARHSLAVAGILAYSSFDSEAIAYARNISVSDAQQQLGELIISCLLTRPEQRYNFTHALVHKFAKEYLNYLVDVVTVYRLIAYFTTIAKVEISKGISGFVSLNNEIAHILSSLDQGVKQELWEQVLELSTSIDEYLDLQGQWANRVQVNLRRKTAASQLRNALEEGRALERLGTSYLSLSDWQVAEEAYQQALSIAEQQDAQSLRGLILQNWGNLLMRQSKLEEATKLYQECIETYKALPHLSGQAKAFNGLGLVELKRGAYQKAKSLFEQSIELFRRANDQDLQGDKARAIDNMATCYRELGDFDKANELHNETVEIFRAAGNIRSELLTIMRLGNVFLERGDLEQAEEFYQKGKKLCEAIGDQYDLNLIINNLAITYRRQKKYDLALKMLNESLEISERLNDLARLGAIHNTRGLIMYEQGRPTDAISDYIDALKYFRITKSLSEQGIALHNLGDAYTELNEFKEAKKRYQQALKKFQKTDSVRHQIYPLVGLGIICKKQGDKEKAKTYWQQALDLSKPELPEHQRLLNLLEGLYE